MKRRVYNLNRTQIHVNTCSSERIKSVSLAGIMLDHVGNQRHTIKVMTIASMFLG